MYCLSWTFTDCIGMVHLGTFTTSIAICWTSSGWVAGSAISAWAYLAYLLFQLVCFYCVCPSGLLSCTHIRTCLFVILDAFSYSYKLTVYLCLHVVIINTRDNLLFYLPIKFLIVAFFCSYSLSLYPLLHI